MKMEYDKNADVLYFRLSDNKIAESQETEKNIVLDYDEANNLVGIEIYNFLKKYKKQVYPVLKEVERYASEP